MTQKRDFGELVFDAQGWVWYILSFWHRMGLVMPIDAIFNLY